MKENDQYKNRKLGWVAYVAGKRESRRLMGDYILKEDDITKTCLMKMLLSPRHGVSIYIGRIRKTVNIFQAMSSKR